MISLSKRANMFKLNLHLKGETVIISLNGNFERFDTIEVIERVEEQIRCRRYNMIFILNGVQSIDNYGVEALFSSMSMVKAWGGKVILADIPKPIRDLPPFRDGLRGFEICDTESEALRHFTPLESKSPR
jgi:anti-anti-sigma regulatory factor